MRHALILFFTFFLFAGDIQAQNEAQVLVDSIEYYCKVDGSPIELKLIQSKKGIKEGAIGAGTIPVRLNVYGKKIPLEYIHASYNFIESYYKRKKKIKSDRPHKIIIREDNNMYLALNGLEGNRKNPYDEIKSNDMLHFKSKENALNVLRVLNRLKALQPNEPTWFTSLEGLPDWEDLKKNDNKDILFLNSQLGIYGNKWARFFYDKETRTIIYRDASKYYVIALGKTKLKKSEMSHVVWKLEVPQKITSSSVYTYLYLHDIVLWGLKKNDIRIYHGYDGLGRKNVKRQRSGVLGMFSISYIDGYLKPKNVQEFKAVLKRVLKNGGQ